MISIVNELNYNFKRQQLLSGMVSGIWQNAFFQGASVYPIFPYKYLTSNFVNFEKNIFRTKTNIVYHLSGYGRTYNESLTSFLGESSERYSYSLCNKTLKPFIKFDSYENMCRKYKNDIVTTLEYVNTLYAEKDEKHFVNKNDKLKWIRMNSLIYPKKHVWIPLQFVLLYDNFTFKDEKRYVTSAVSTGTAGHENVKSALANALIEYLQLDSFNLWWFCGVRDNHSQSFDGDEKVKKWFWDEKYKCFLKKFTVKFTDISFDKNIYVYVCELIGKQNALPKYTVGIQGGLDKEQCLYRSFMEALTVLEYSMNLSWIVPDKFNVESVNGVIGNLDDNVLKYNIYGKPSLKENPVDFIYKKKVTSISEILVDLKNYSKFAGFLEVTPMDFEGLNLKVVKVIIPELLPMFLPTFPAVNHPRINKFGGVLNKIAHPLA